MSGFNLPPGVSVSDIPGNRPEDALDEKFWDAMIDRAPEDLPEEWYEDERFIAIVIAARDLGYNQGLDDGRYDEAMAQMEKEEA